MRANLWLAPSSRFAEGYAREALLFGALGGMLIALTAYCVALGLAIAEAL